MVFVVGKNTSHAGIRDCFATQTSNANMIQLGNTDLNNGACLDASKSG
jgi:hypothetical protein